MYEFSRNDLKLISNIEYQWSLQKSGIPALFLIMLMLLTKIGSSSVEDVGVILVDSCITLWSLNFSVVSKKWWLSEQLRRSRFMSPIIWGLTQYLYNYQEVIWCDSMSSLWSWVVDKNKERETYCYYGRLSQHISIQYH